MKKRCPHCNKYTFSYLELFFPYPIADYPIPCSGCSMKVYPQEIFVIIPKAAMSLFLLVASALVMIGIMFGVLPSIASY